jgi:uncharacterized protein
LQTNGTLLDSDWLELFISEQIQFGVSLDGPPEMADKSRKFRNGRSTTNNVLERIQHLRAQYPTMDEVFGGVLCVINPQLDGAAVVDWFTNNGLRDFEFLLPDATYVNLPAGAPGLQEYVEPYRKFLISAFRRWYEGGKNRPTIRLFESMGMGFFGRRPTLDALGGDLRHLCVVESDGSIGISDVVRICGQGYERDTIDIFSHSLDCRSLHYNIEELQKVSKSCRDCKFLYSCGGGYLPHRFDGKSFDNPSLYCAALKGVLEEMYAAFRRDSPDGIWTSV